MKNIVFILSFIFSTYSFGVTNTYFCNDSFGKHPIQQGGRVKPLNVHAKEMMKYLTGKRKVDGLSPLMAYCLLSLEGMGLKNDLKFQIPVEHSQTRELLGFKGSKLVPISEVESQIDLLRAESAKATPDSSFQKSLNKLINKVALYRNITSSNNWLIPEASDKEGEANWVPISAYLQEKKIIEAKKVSDEPFVHVLNNAALNYEKINPKSTHKLEFTYDKANLPAWNMIITLVALFCLTLFKSFKSALALSFLTIGLQTTHMVLRILISGRAPITNMYETVMFSGYGALVLALIVGHYKKEKTFVYVGLAYSFCTLMMMNFAGGMLSPNISPLVPVLRDNFWLSTHVTTIILSYGALALSWILGNTVLIKGRLGKLGPNDGRYYSDLIYTCLKYGTILLGAGIVLGGVWADYSWGRFWGWDPKETWSLIVLCIYMAILHGKYTNWIPVKRFIPLVTASFMSVMMAWFGVNYILAAGLHSYGFSEGGAVFLGSFFLIQTIILVITWNPRKNSVELTNA